MSTLVTLADRGRRILPIVAALSTDEKNNALQSIAQALRLHTAEIVEANKMDVENARNAQMSESMIDRLLLTEERIQGLADAVLEIVQLEDPVGEVLSGKTFPNGIRQIQRTVPFGLIGVIYESRPNVTVDIAALCLKSGNGCLLRGGKEAIHSNMALTSIIQTALAPMGLSDAVLLVEDTNRATAEEMMTLTGKLDLLIPRGGASLIQQVVSKAKVPVIETGTGVCHLYAEETADIEMAIKILINGKTTRPGVCNSLETLLVDEKIAETFLPQAYAALSDYNVTFWGDEKTQTILKNMPIVPIKDADYATEHLDFILSVRVVDNIDMAIDHIATHSTHHSEAIITTSLTASQKFTDKVDSAAVYVNASTRFTDGGEFGLGAEIGISTQKLHVRGPVGLKNLVSYKYILMGDGQIR